MHIVVGVVVGIATVMGFIVLPILMAKGFHRLDDPPLPKLR